MIKRYHHRLLIILYAYLKASIYIDVIDKTDLAFVGLQ